MQSSFWHERWKQNEIGFHESKTNPLLRRFFKKLDLPKGDRVLVPLCGKTLDIRWLLSRGYSVVGAELSKIAIEQLFRELRVKPGVSKAGKLHRYSAEGIDIFVGNIFDLSGRRMGPVDAIYDRAALVALPARMRSKYTRHLMEITRDAPQLLICYDYDQDMMAGPPFSISDQELTGYYGETYDLTVLSAKMSLKD